MAKILIIDDETDIAELISDSLEFEGYKTITANSAEEALKKINNNNDIDLILLDIMLPNMSGTELLGKIREHIKVPVILVSAKVGTIDKLLGFELGADDYITKPFDINELVARVKAHLRRETRQVNEKKTIKIRDIEINKDSYDVLLNGVKQNTTTREVEVLWYLMSNAGTVLSKDQIFTSVWGSNYGDIGTVAVHIKSLRNKLDKEEEYIKTVWGVGYKFISE